VQGGEGDVYRARFFECAFLCWDELSIRLLEVEIVVCASLQLRLFVCVLEDFHGAKFVSHVPRAVLPDVDGRDLVAESSQAAYDELAGDDGDVVLGTARAEEDAYVLFICFLVIFHGLGWILLVVVVRPIVLEEDDVAGTCDDGEFGVGVLCGFAYADLFPVEAGVLQAAQYVRCDARFYQKYEIGDCGDFTSHSIVDFFGCRTKFDEAGGEVYFSLIFESCEDVECLPHARGVAVVRVVYYKDVCALVLDRFETVGNGREFFYAVLYFGFCELEFLCRDVCRGEGADGIAGEEGDGEGLLIDGEG